MQTRSQTTKSQSQSQSQPSQPPKQAAYTQSTNPIDHTPLEQRTPKPNPTTQPPPPPSNDEALRQLNAKRAEQRTALQDTPDVDTEYGVEQQPAEGDIARAVEGKTAERRAQAQEQAQTGAEMRPGDPGYEKGQAADLDRKGEEHERMLGERMMGVGESLWRGRMRRLGRGS
ncbi:hypothetical protein BO70DRAFT_426785 [Aspergillus heteromorphus CBS 117.55]|uniref:Uncharacterized protein n=1 Tax=Aspergillus heteromorphus CBS 117.55 TaxID=1448321 RepID=A0A317WRU2_9EURO|nr:uncharacterized protein BO70DRAFT_426785 [Aspergillus heteromorphus CBS 117.55]PWY89119.1 hypothetical protein BO70DRAFT_426785 [Aspergillus heteromorphus CBS 117.55]